MAPVLPIRPSEGAPRTTRVILGSNLGNKSAFRNVIVELVVDTKRGESGVFFIAVYGLGAIAASI